MGRPPSTGGPSFRFNSTEVAEMESILQAHNAAMPAREVLEALAQKFSVSAERSGKFVVQMKQVWHWFQNRRYALRAKAAKAQGNLNVSALPQDDSVIATNVPQAPQPIPAPPVRIVPQAPQHLPAPAVQGAGRNGADSNSMEFEAKSARDGAWYDVATFLSHRKLETGESDVLVRFAGFGAEEDEWVNVSKLVRQRSLPCESSECVAVLQGDLILCFQEGKEQALYFDAHVLDAQRRRHDMRGCRCRFLVRYDHDQSEEIVPLRKVCRRPETDYRLQQLHALNESATNQPKAGAADPRTANTLRVYPPAEATKKQHKLEEHADVAIVMPAASHTNLPAVTEIKVQQPKVTEIINAGNLGNSNVQPGNIVMQPKVEIMDAGTREISNVSPGNVVQQTEVTEIGQTSILGSSNVAQRNVVQQHEVTEIVNDGNQGNSNLLQGNVVQQQEVTEILNDGNQGDSNVPPGNTIEQPKVTDIINADVPGSSHVPPGNVILQPEATEIVSSAGILGNANAPPGNVV